MAEYLPILIVGAIIGTFAVAFIVAFATMKDKKAAIGFDRHMDDGEIVKRLLRYAAPHWRSFALVLLIMLISVGYDIVSPLIIGEVVAIMGEEFTMPQLLILVAAYGGMLLISMVCTYFQYIFLKKSGQKIRTFFSGDDETRTRYLIAASDALSQVSYDPM